MHPVHNERVQLQPTGSGHNPTVGKVLKCQTVLNGTTDYYVLLPNNIVKNVRLSDMRPLSEPQSTNPAGAVRGAVSKWVANNLFFGN